MSCEIPTSCKSVQPGQLSRSNDIAQTPGIHEDLINRYVAAQVTHDRAGALAVVDEAVASGAPLPEIYVHLIQRAQYELGRLWQDNTISIGQEHSGTAISQLALTHLYTRLPRAEKIGKTVLIACVESELHDLGARMVSDAFEMHGYDVIYLGANVPTDTLVDTILDVKPDVVGLSVTMSFNVTAMYEVVRRVRDSAGDDIAFLGGGYGITWLKDAPDNLLIAAASGDAFQDVNRLSLQRTGVPEENTPGPR
jgi:MerR family transcriptional regulator, light-induced transcriptional regulator